MGGSPGLPNSIAQHADSSRGCVRWQLRIQPFGVVVCSNNPHGVSETAFRSTNHGTATLAHHSVKYLAILPVMETQMRPCALPVRFNEQQNRQDNSGHLPLLTILYIR
jgi:hypothetical protein